MLDQWPSSLFLRQVQHHYHHVHPPPQSCLHPVSYHADDLNDAKLSGVKRLVVFFFFKSIVQFEDTFTDLTMWEIP